MAIGTRSEVESRTLLTLRVGDHELPMKLHRAAIAVEAGLNMFSEQGNPIGRKNYDKVTGQEVVTARKGRMIDGEPVYLTEDEIASAYSLPNARVECVQAEYVDLSCDDLFVFVKEVYFIEALDQLLFDKVVGRLLETKRQLKFNWVKDKRRRSCALTFATYDGKAIPVIAVRYYPCEVLPVPKETGTCPEDERKKVDEVLDSIASVSISDVDGNEDKTLEELLARRLAEQRKQTVAGIGGK